jgi:tetratricopeptide (TPR) repeat protein
MTKENMIPSHKENYFRNQINNKSINSLLDEVEANLGRLDGSISPMAERIFLLLDEIHQQTEFLRQNDFEFVKINTQLDYVTKKLHSSAKLLLKSIGGREALKNKRKLYGIKENQWWWHLDHYLEEKKKKDLKRTSMIVLILVIIGAILVLIYDQFLAPPPEVRARLDYESRIDEYIDAGDYPNAFSVMEDALELAPDYYPLWIKNGVLAKVMGNEELEKTSFDKALQNVEDLENFYYERSSVYMQFGLLDEVLSDADRLEEINPQSPEAFLYRGLVYEQSGQMSDAYDAFEKAAVFAEDQNKIQLAATIKVRMGMIMQSITIPTQNQ